MGLKTQTDCSCLRIHEDTWININIVAGSSALCEVTKGNTASMGKMDPCLMSTTPPTRCCLCPFTPSAPFYTQPSRQLRGPRKCQFQMEAVNRGLINFFQDIKSQTHSCFFLFFFKYIHLKVYSELMSVVNWKQ